MMENYRKDSPAIINGNNVVLIKDYLTQKASSLFDGEEEDIKLPKSNVLQFFLEDGTKISIRPSGTEPKIKFYFGVKAPLKNAGDDRNFDRIGVPALWFNTHEHFRDFHTPDDSLETIDAGTIARCVEEAVRVTRQLCKQNFN